MTWLIPLAFVLGALGRRVAGGVLNQWFAAPGERVFGDTPARLIFGATVYLAALLGGWQFFPALALIPSVWVGTTIGNYDAIDLGRNEGSFARDWFALQLHGLAGVALPALLAWYFSLPWWPVLAAGLAISPLYLVGWALCGRSTKSNYPLGLRQATEIGEALWGGAVGVGAFLAGVLA